MTLSNLGQVKIGYRSSDMEIHQLSDQNQEEPAAKFGDFIGTNISKKSGFVNRKFC